MDIKENLSAGRPGMTPFIKPEPQESRIYPLGSSQGLPGAIADERVPVKSEVTDAARVFIDRGLPVPSYASGSSTLNAVNSAPSAVAKRDGVDMAGASTRISSNAFLNPAEVKKPLYTVYQSAEQIVYQPEDALKEGTAMVKTLKTNIREKLKLGKLREEVWLREIESLQNQGAPTTMIAVCGATGAGKSSILNAILDDNIVPTSGMRACTAVVTEIAHHAKKTIEGDVSFLSEAEWRQELTVLLDDLVDEDGNLKRSTDLRSDAGVAWQKVHAVYPAVSPEQLIRMSVDQIIALDQNVARILGTTKHIVANDSKSFAKEIGKYIDSKDQKRGEKSKKDKAKEKEKKEKQKGKSLIEKMREQNKSKNASLGIGAGQGTKSAAKPEDDPDGPAYWPLIRQVQVKCNAKALSTGAILVDLPGVADANAARNNIAKDYMKKCDCIWILAPITRAVDDKTARDLMGDAFKMQLMSNYDDNAITFIATKCDDISCSEVIRALRLEDDPELQKIEDEIDTCNVETEDWKEKKAEAEANAKATDQVLKQLRPQLAEYEEHLKALRNGETFVPKLTAKKKTQATSDDDIEGSDSDSDKDESPRGKKRKSNSSRAKASKRRKSGGDDDFIDDDEDEELVFSDSESEHGRSSGPGSDPESSSSEEESEDEDAMEEDVTEESLQAKIKEVQDNIKQGRIDLSEYRRLRKEASDAIAALKKRQVKAQREKNAFCSLKRSEFSRDVLKEDFRVGLKDLDDAAAEQRDPDNFDPTVDVRDYNAINLPVFTCSSRDYVRLKGQVQGDGDPTCFSKVEDTGVPALQDWCHHLTVASRERAARNFLTHLRTFANSVKVYLEGSADVTQADREALKEAWESSIPDDASDGDIFGAGWASSDDLLDLPGLAMLADPLGSHGGLYSLNSTTRKEPKVDRYGELVGVTPRLVRDFADVVEDCVDELKKKFQDGLAEKCRIGATNAASAAVETSDNFAASMHWATYRATLRRHGSWRQDLNVELSNPFTRQIASTWSQVFEADLFGGFEKATNDAIAKLMKEIEDSAAPGLKDRVRVQGELALDEARVALQKTIDVVKDTINTQQKEVSRCLAPHVQNQLFDGYETAMQERGRGSVARQKAVFHNIVNEIKNEMFDDAADVILGRLAEAAEAVGKALGEALQALAEKVIAVVQQIMNQVQLWQTAAQSARVASHSFV
ncbi:Dynamin family-domain-containing protein [Irpex lacteus]|nr:Dynamin family-domain-containing protein [Irpex lacteus]